MKAIIKSEGEKLGEINLNEKGFKTGSVGFHGFGKVEIRGKRYQANFLLVEIGSKERKVKE